MIWIQGLRNYKGIKPGKVEKLPRGLAIKLIMLGIVKPFKAIKEV